MKEAKFILFSFDVKMDGKNACRLGDKMTMNHQNTVCLAGTFPTDAALPVRDRLRELPQSSKHEGGCGDQAQRGYSDCEKKEICKKVRGGE